MTAHLYNPDSKTGIPETGVLSDSNGNRVGK